MIPASPTRLQPRSRWIGWALAALLVWSAALRVWMASVGLASGHYWDERYSLRNLRAVLETGSIEPVNFYYPSLSYLPQAALLGGVEAVAGAVTDQPFSFFDGGRLRPVGYLLARLVQVACGLGTLILTFLLGRRLRSPEVGLLAALLLAVAPQHVRLSTMWKPDVTLLLAVLAALWWSLDALDRPTLRRYLLAGAGVGLALASKLNGGPIAAPLALGAIVAGFTDRRHWRGLAAAGVAAIGVFTLLNPRVASYFAALERNRELYSGRAAGPDPSFLARFAGVAREEIRFVLSPNFHGTWIGIAALVGMLAVGALAARRRDRATARTALAILAFPIAYTLLYALSTPYAKENNFLQILPFTALGAALFLSLAASRLDAALPAWVRRPAPAIACLAIAVAVAAPTQAWVYRTLVPSTWNLAVASLARGLRPLEGRVGWIEAPRSVLAGQPRERRAVLRAVDDLAAVAPDLLDQADAVAFAARRTGASPLHAALAAPRPPETVDRFSARWFLARGPAVLTVLRPREAAGSWTVEPIPLEDGWFRIDLPPLPIAAETLSIELWRHRSRASTGDPQLVVGERSLRLEARPSGRLTSWLSERFTPGASSAAARLPDAAPNEQLAPVRIYAWSGAR